MQSKNLLTSGCLSGSSLLLDLSLLFLLAEAGDRSEDRGTLAGSATALAGLLLLLFFLLLLLGLSSSLDVLGSLLSLGLSSLDLGGLLGQGGGDSMDRLAQKAVALLVGLGLDNSWGQFLGLSLLGLQGGNPAIALGNVGSLEGVLVAGDSEEEVG